MTDIEFAKKQNQIFVDFPDQKEMLQELDKLNQQYFAESVPYNKILEREDK